MRWRMAMVRSLVVATLCVPMWYLIINTKTYWALPIMFVIQMMAATSEIGKTIIRRDNNE